MIQPHDQIIYCSYFILLTWITNVLTFYTSLLSRNFKTSPVIK